MEKFEVRVKSNRSANRKLLYGVGVQDADYVTRYTSSTGKEISCPYFARWKSLIKRCYFDKARSPTYEECFVCDEWLIFSNFKAWMEQQSWEGKDLDKDLLYPGNKVYCPEKCIFVATIVNNFLTEVKRNNKSGLIGACKHKSGGFQSNCRNPLTDRIEYLGYFKTAEEAHFVWGLRKHQLACELADSQFVDCDRIRDALKSRYITFQKYENRNKELSV